MTPSTEFSNNSKICIIGCGWLGFPLAVSLISRGYQVYGSTTSQEKMRGLSDAGIQSFVFNLDDSDMKIPVCDHYFINIPPSGSQNYINGLQSLINKIPVDAQNVIYCSTTSVYPDQPEYICVEKDIIPGNIDENDNPDASNHGTPRRTLILAEGIFHRHPNSTILRLSGLFGPNRHPVKYLSGRKNISRPLAVVNLIHLEDIIATSVKLLEKKSPYQIFNVTATEHPTRFEYYTQAAQKAGIAPPEFDLNDKTTGKIVDHTRLVELLGYAPTLKDK